MYASVQSACLCGSSALPITVEADITGGLPRFELAGLSSSAAAETRKRVRSAIRNSGMNYPVSRITVNLAPAELRKDGPLYDLPVFTAVLCAAGQLSQEAAANAFFLGELSLSGEVRPVHGVLPMLLAAKEAGASAAYLPAENAGEASVVRGLPVYPVRTAGELIEHLNGVCPISPVIPLTLPQDIRFPGYLSSAPDFRDIHGMEVPKRIMEIAAAGGHSVLMVGPPGSGKTLLANALPSILPTMTYEEALETTRIYSVAGRLPTGTALLEERPFRAPHHTITPAAMAGGGIRSLPGEISLAHNGILFLDELPLFSRSVLNSLLQPLEEGVIRLARGTSISVYPSHLLLVGAMNPCPCGYRGAAGHRCTCSDGEVRAYLHSLSGALLDRIDLQIVLEPPPEKDLLQEGCAQTSAEIRARVEQARDIQRQRYRGLPVTCNGALTAPMVREYCRLSQEAEALLLQAHRSLHFSARVHDKILKTARTLADLSGEPEIRREHLLEALSCRTLPILGNRST